MTETLAVVGHPIGHSLSPVMHSAALSALGLGDRIRYVARDVPPEALSDLFAELRDGRLLGVNVTLPHKRAVMPLLDRIDDEARRIGAVNTIARASDGALVGSNTDAPGLVRALTGGGVALSGARVVVLGAGGAARAALVGLRAAGVGHLSVAARRPSEAAALVAELGADASSSLDRDGLRAALGGASLLIQATSATLEPAAGAALASSIPFDAMARGATVSDLVYRPRRTAVLVAAEAAGLRTLDGTEMLIEQGALSLERWLGIAAPVEAMRDAVRAALGPS